jgi:hypothetical protein
MQLRRRELSLAALAVASCAVIVFVSMQPFRLVAATVLVLLLPGRALAAATLHDRASWPECLAVTLGGGLALVVLTALVLDVLSIPLDRAEWAIALGAVAVAASFVAAVRGRPAVRGIPRPRLDLRSTAFMTVAAVLLAAAFFVGVRPLPAPSSAVGYTSLWLEAAVPGRVVAVVRSSELETTAFRLAVTVDGQALASRQVRLSPRAEFRLPVRVRPAALAHVTAVLDRVGASSAGRQRAALVLRGGVVPTPAHHR